MSQAEINVRERQVDSISRRSNGVQLAGILFFIMVLGAIIWSGWSVMEWMKSSMRAPISKLVILGERCYTTDQDIRQAILALGTPSTFMKENVDIIQQKIKHFPWIKQVSVRKQWPDELRIYIQEYEPIAHWNDSFMIDAQGDRFSLPAQRLGKQIFPLLYGPEGSEKDVLDGYREMSKKLTANGYTLKMVAMSARHSWQLALSNDVRLELGRDERMERLQRFIEFYPILVQQGKIENKRVSYVDLRYETGAAVGWSPELLTSSENTTSTTEEQPRAHQQQNYMQAKQQ